MQEPQMYVISITRCPNFFFVFLLPSSPPGGGLQEVRAWERGGHGCADLQESLFPCRHHLVLAQKRPWGECCGLLLLPSCLPCCPVLVPPELLQSSALPGRRISLVVSQHCPETPLLPPPPSSSSRTPLGDTSSSPVATRQSYASLNWILSRTQASIPATAPTPTAPGVPR